MDLACRRESLTSAQHGTLISTCRILTRMLLETITLWTQPLLCSKLVIREDNSLLWMIDLRVAHRLLLGVSSWCKIEELAPRITEAWVSSLTKWMRLEKAQEHLQLIMWRCQAIELPNRDLCSRRFMILSRYSSPMSWKLANHLLILTPSVRISKQQVFPEQPSSYFSLFPRTRFWFASRTSLTPL